MIFPADVAKLIVKRKKTSHRVRAKGRRHCRYAVGHHYPVAIGRELEAVAVVTVLDVERQRLGDMTYQDVLAEGCLSTADFARRWTVLNDARCDLAGLTGDEVVALWRERHGETLVWVVRFELKRQLLQVIVPDVPVYLHRNPARGTTTDPSYKAAREPEVVGATIGAGATRALREAEQARGDEIRRRQALVERARQALERAVDAGVDVAVLEQQVADLVRALRAA